MIEKDPGSSEAEDLTGLTGMENVRGETGRRGPVSSFIVYYYLVFAEQFNKR